MLKIVVWCFAFSLVITLWCGLCTW